MESSKGAVAECCFVDVAQGSANVILLGERRAVVIDCGPPSDLGTIRILDHFGIESIVALIITHNHADHCGAAESVLSKFRGAIDAVFFLEDRPSDHNMFLRRIRQELDRGTLSKNQVRRLEGPCTLSLGPNLHLAVISPRMIENVEARMRGEPNASSAVLRLQCGSKSVLFPGDVDETQLRAFVEDGIAPLRCDVLAVPHHGGKLGSSTSTEFYEWVYSKVFRCTTAVVSVGSSNGNGHPKPDHMAAISRSGASVLCTQITPRCHEDLERLRPGIVASDLPGRSSAKPELTQAGCSKNIACAGSVFVEIGPNHINVKRLDQHRGGVDALMDDPHGHPLCRCDE